MNSVGKLPIDYLNLPESHRASAALANAQQIIRQYLVKENSKLQTELFFKPYAPLFNHRALLSDIESLISRAEDAAMAEGAGGVDAAGLYTKAITQSMQLAETAIEGLRYYQTYDWLFLRSIITAGYVGWIAYSLLFVIKSYGNSGIVSQESANTHKKGSASRLVKGHVNSSLKLWISDRQVRIVIVAHCWLSF